MDGAWVWMAPMGPQDGWALSRNGPSAWIGPEHDSGWMGPGQKWALGIDGFWALLTGDYIYEKDQLSLGKTPKRATFL